MKLRVRVENRAYEVDVEFLDSEESSHEGRRAARIPIPESVVRPRAPQRLPEDSVCRSPIAGRVAAVTAAAGRKVRHNEPVVVIEAMKMEVPIGPAVDGTVRVVHVKAGDSVTAGQALFDLS
jgi:biotin carboxyl carrier protein